MKADRHKSYLKELGKNIRTLRKERGISMAVLSYEAEMDFRLLGRIERGEGNTTVVSLLKIAEALDVDLMQLFNFQYSKKK